MNFATGTRLGPYEIDRPIGKGGMGEVYRANDPRLGRTVAIKVLAAGSSGNDEERLRRFELESRTVGALNHPNLLTLHDVGRHEGRPYIVTELLTGDTLRKHLGGGALGVQEALRIAAEVARGLAAAHAKDIVHRDIKPENLFVTDSGRIKILDFGVAKLANEAKEEPPSNDDPALLQTALDTPRTSTGMVIGTPGYMAPEQLRSDPIDARTDVFALGVVLYEMLAGSRPFVAETSVEESYAILKTAAPPLSAKVPEAVDQLVRRCLEKKPELRFQSASDLAFALDALVTVGARRPPSAMALPALPKPGAKPRGKPVALIAAAVAVMAAAIAFWIGRSTSSAPAVVSPAPAPAPADQRQYRRVTFGSASSALARFIPNEASIVYTQLREGVWHVVSTQIDHPTLVQLGEGRLLDISKRRELALSNGGFFGGELRRVSMMGGSAPRVIATEVVDACWAPDGEQLAIVRRLADGMVLEFPVGTPIVRRQGVMLWVRISRDGKHIAFAETSGGETRGRVVIVDLTGREVSASTPRDVYGLDWSPDGSEVWFGAPSRDPAENAIRAVDLEKRERVVLRTASFPQLHAVASDGRFLFAPHEARTRLFVLRRGEQPREASYFDGTVVQGISADGAMVAFVEGHGTGSDTNGVYAAFTRVIGQQPVRIGYARRLALLPDKLAAIALVGDREPLVRIPTGAGNPVKLPQGSVERFDLDDHLEVAWKTPRIAFRAAAAGKPMRLWIQDLGGGDPRPVGPETAPSGRQHPISPDGAWIAVGDPRGLRLISTTGNPDRPIEGPPNEVPIAFTDDGKAVFAITATGTPRALTRVELANRKRTPWATLELHDRGYFSVRMSADGSTIAFSTTSDDSDVFVVETPR